jgi:epsin
MSGFFENLTNQISQITLYDVKDAINKVRYPQLFPSLSHVALTQAKAVVMNYTEMEAKVREATSNDPWYVE